MKISFLKPVGTPEGLTFWSTCLLVTSMVLSPFLLSVSMWALVGAAFWQSARVLRAERGRVAAGAVIGSTFVRLWYRKELALMTLLLLVPALSAFWSDDLGYWLRVTRVRLPFLVLPWAFANLPRLEDRRYKAVLLLLVWCMVVLCIGVGINFILHYDTIMDALGRGQPIPVPRQHVRFSLVLATAILAGGRLWQQGFYWRYTWETRALAAAVAFLFVFIHILSVRGGLAALYIGLLWFLFAYVRQTGRWRAGALAVIAIAGVLWLALATIPSLQQRIAYMRYDWERYQAGRGEAYSDASRWVSLKTGYLIWEAHPLLGVGAGDLLSEVKRVTAERFPEYARFPKLPHNQWLHIMAGTGLLGLLLSVIAFVAPVFYSRRRSKPMFAAFQCMVFVTFIIECTVENAIGVAWYLFYTLWLLESENESLP